MVPLSGWKECGYQYHTGPMFWAAVYLHPPVSLKTSKFDNKLIYKPFFFIIQLHFFFLDKIRIKSCTCFHLYVTTTLNNIILESMGRRGGGGGRGTVENISKTTSSKVRSWTGIELVTPGSAIRLALTANGRQSDNLKDCKDYMYFTEHYTNPQVF